MKPELQFNWNLIYKCNYRCPYCFFYGRWHKLPRINEEFSLDKWIKAWHRIYERFGSVLIEITGGEPFIYPNFTELIKELIKEHYISTITNLSWGIGAITEFIKQIDYSRLTICLSFHPVFAKLETFLEKALFLKERGISDRVFYVIYPPQFGRIGYFKEKFEQAGIKFVAIPFRGGYQGVIYPKGYTEEEKNIFYSNLSKDAEEYQKKWVVDQVMQKNTKGRLCRAGQKYVYIDIYGMLHRCSFAVDGQIGNFFDENFQLLDKPAPCKNEVCPCESKWLVE